MIRDLATETRSDAIVYKEFGKNDLEWSKPLLDLGYRQIPTPPMHFFKPSFRDFAEYCAALRTRYRQQINRSIRKLKDPGIRQAILTDAKEISRLYTAEVHGLYCQMAAKADAKLEILPIEFFRQLTLRLEGDVDLLVIFKDLKIIAFGWCLHAGSSYHLLFAGLDYALNEELDLYFNLMYAGLDRALRKRVSTIHVGQSADAFKARIGCHSEPLYVLAKGLTPLIALLVRFAGNLLVVHRTVILRQIFFERKSKTRRDGEGCARQCERMQVQIGSNLVRQARRVQPGHQMTSRPLRHSVRAGFCDHDHSASNVACDSLMQMGTRADALIDETEYCDDERCNAEPKRPEFAKDITSHEQRLAREPRFDLRHDHQACEDCVNIYGTHAEL